MREELRRCPFCGGEAEIRPIPPINPMPINPLASRVICPTVSIGCSNPECIVFVGMTKPYQTREEAKMAWNRRA